MAEPATPSPVVNLGRSDSSVSVNDFNNHESGTQPLSATPELLEFLAAESKKLETATPREIVRWAVDHYFPKLTMATAFGPEGCAIIHMLAQIEPRVHVFNLDTGYQFKETLELRDKIAQRYGIDVEYKRPDTTVEVYEAQHGGPLYKTNPDQCCADRKVKVLKEAAKGWHAWMSGIRRDQSPDRAKVADRRLGQEIQPGENQPVGELDEKRNLETDHRRKRSVQPAARPRLPQHRLLALHARRDVRRRRTRRPLERFPKNRVRAAYERMMNRGDAETQSRQQKINKEARNAGTARKHEDRRLQQFFPGFLVSWLPV